MSKTKKTDKVKPARKTKKMEPNPKKSKALTVKSIFKSIGKKSEKIVISSIQESQTLSVPLDLNEPVGTNGGTILMIACEHECVNVVEELLLPKYNININQKDLFYEATAIYNVLRHSPNKKSEKLANLLLDRNIDVTIKPCQYTNLLIMACNRNYPTEIIQKLINLGVDMTSTAYDFNRTSTTPLLSTLDYMNSNSVFITLDKKHKKQIIDNIKNNALVIIETGKANLCHRDEHSENAFIAACKYRLFDIALIIFKQDTCIIKNDIEKALNYVNYFITIFEGKEKIYKDEINLYANPVPLKEALDLRLIELNAV